MLYKTLVKKDHKLGNNKYVLGRISGIKHVICSNDKSQRYGNSGVDNGVVLRVDCEKSKYDEFVTMIEDLYPGLCEFYYMDK